MNKRNVMVFRAEICCFLDQTTCTSCLFISLYNHQREPVVFSSTPAGLTCEGCVLVHVCVSLHVCGVTCSCRESYCSQSQAYMQQPQHSEREGFSVKRWVQLESAHTRYFSHHIVLKDVISIFTNNTAFKYTISKKQSITNIFVIRFIQN